MKVEVGSAPNSWGVWFPSDPRQTPWKRFLDEISEAGYEWTELGPYGYLPSDLKILRPELERRGLKVTGSFVMGDLANPATSWPEIERQLRDWGPILKDLAAGFLVLIDNTYTDLFSGEARSAPRLDDRAFQVWWTRPGELPKSPAGTTGFSSSSIRMPQLTWSMKTR